jgi:hypothetical protein
MERKKFKFQLSTVLTLFLVATAEDSVKKHFSVGASSIFYRRLHST